LGDEIELVALLDREPVGVEMDRGQLTQLILNLAVNARDAMPDGGRLTLRTSVRTVTAGEPHSGVLKEPGRYAVLTVEDTGTGMPPEVQKRIFEPFYTTKEEGRGTGLGLAMVHAAVSQSRGQIEVASEVDHGSTFTIFLPAAEPSRGEKVDAEGEGRAAAETRSILVVDDDEAVRQVVCRMLRACGYAVVPAASGVEALEAVHTRGVRADLLLTDVSMPEMNGWQLAATMRAGNPALPVLFMSGRPDGGAPPELAAAGTAFLPKPIQLRDLQRQVQALLGTGA
ncbi:MAG: ATP-binding protein, partial [Candidatus Latescibacterota bacterium]